MNTIKAKNEKINHDIAENNTHNSMSIISIKITRIKETSQPSDCLM